MQITSGVQEAGPHSLVVFRRDGNAPQVHILHPMRVLIKIISHPHVENRTQNHINGGADLILIRWRHVPSRLDCVSIGMSLYAS